MTGRRLSLRASCSIPAVDRLHFCDAAVGAEDYREGDMLRRHVDVGVVEAPSVTVVQPCVQTGDGFGFGPAHQFRDRIPIWPDQFRVGQHESILLMILSAH
jgi:hypothetical protein